MSFKADWKKLVSLFFELLDLVFVKKNKTVDIYKSGQVIGKEPSIECLYEILGDWVKFGKSLYDITHRHELPLFLWAANVCIQPRLYHMQGV